LGEFYKPGETTLERFRLSQSKLDSSVAVLESNSQRKSSQKIESPKSTLPLLHSSSTSATTLRLKRRLETLGSISFKKKSMGNGDKNQDECVIPVSQSSLSLTKVTSNDFLEKDLPVWDADKEDGLRNKLSSSDSECEASTTGFRDNEIIRKKDIVGDPTLTLVSGTPNKDFQNAQADHDAQKEAWASASDEHVSALPEECTFDEVDAQVRILTTKHFLEMDICGQFNRGFIVTRLGTDYFMIDQHAADEKQKFERLIMAHGRPTQVQSLMQPICLREHVSAHDLAKLSDPDVRMQLEMHHGFFVDEDLALKAVPMRVAGANKYTPQGIQDMLDVLYSSGQASGQVRAACASRACRTAVMIGMVLDKKKMTSIVRGLSDLVHPWVLNSLSFCKFSVREMIS
jgi:DNA mismatch repair ATPase MutL